MKKLEPPVLESGRSVAKRKKKRIVATSNLHSTHMINLTLYPEPMLPAIQPAPNWNPFGKDLPVVLAATWLEIMDGFHYGTLTAYMLRAYGYPNIPAYDPFRNGHCWGLATEGGHVMRIQCPPMIISGYSSSAPKDRGSMVRDLAESGCFQILPVAIKPETLSTDVLTQLVMSFRDPIYVDELGADAMGPLAPERDVGPGANSVRRAGASTGNLIVLPRVVKEEDRDVLRVVDTLVNKIKF